MKSPSWCLHPKYRIYSFCLWGWLYKKISLSYKNPINGAIPVPGPTIIMDLFGSSGNLKLDSLKSTLTLTHSPSKSFFWTFMKYYEHKPNFSVPFGSVSINKLSAISTC